MLHIILLILKILGFLILVLAGLMLVAVITVLFAPAGYRFDLTAEEFGKYFCIAAFPALCIIWL